MKYRDAEAKRQRSSVVARLKVRPCFHTDYVVGFQDGFEAGYDAAVEKLRSEEAENFTDWPKELEGTRYFAMKIQEQSTAKGLAGAFEAILKRELGERMAEKECIEEMYTEKKGFIP